MVNLTITHLLYKEIIWNKEKVVIERNGTKSEMKRLEFQYEAIDKDYIIHWIEPMYDKETDTPFLLIHCE